MFWTFDWLTALYCHSISWAIINDVGATVLISSSVLFFIVIVRQSWFAFVAAGWSQLKGTQGCAAGFFKERRNTAAWNKSELPFFCLCITVYCVLVVRLKLPLEHFLQMSLTGCFSVRCILLAEELQADCSENLQLILHCLIQLFYFTPCKVCCLFIIAVCCYTYICPYNALLLFSVCWYHKITLAYKNFCLHKFSVMPNNMN